MKSSLQLIRVTCSNLHCCHSQCWQRTAEVPTRCRSPETSSVSDRGTRSAEWDLPLLMLTINKGNPSWVPLVCWEGVKSSSEGEGAALTCSGVLKRAKCNSAQHVSISQLRTVVFDCFPILLPLQVFCSRWMSIQPPVWLLPPGP